MTTRAPPQSTVTIDLRTAPDAERETWNEYIARSPQGNFFHQFEALQTMAKYTDSELYPLVGYDEGDPVGVFPVFKQTKMYLNTVFSPPPYTWVPHLGPALLEANSARSDEDERRHHQFFDECLRWIDATIHPWYVHLQADVEYTDTRPLQRNSFDILLSHTYVVDLSLGENELFHQFSSDARHNVREGEDIDYVIKEGGTDAIGGIVQRVRERYEEQGKSFGVEPAFIAELYDRLPDGQVRPYVFRLEGEFVGGMIVLEYQDTVYRWLGGVKPDVDAPVNDLLDWRIMRDAIDRGTGRYDLVGADYPRLNEYKAKFNPELFQYYRAERANPVVRLFANAYDKLYTRGYF